MQPRARVTVHSAAPRQLASPGTGVLSGVIAGSLGRTWGQTLATATPPVQLPPCSRPPLPCRGVALWSGLPPTHTRLCWQLCWSLNLFTSPGVDTLPCQLMAHQVHISVPNDNQASADSTGSAPSAAGPAPWQKLQKLQKLPGGGGGDRGGEDRERHPSSSQDPQGARGAASAGGGQQHGQPSLLLLAAACDLVLVVVLSMYGADVEDGVAGG